MSNFNPNEVEEKVELTDITGDGLSEPVVRTPGGPGWLSEHSMILWIVGIVLILAAFVTYMIVDNS